MGFNLKVLNADNTHYLVEFSGLPNNVEHLPFLNKIRREFYNLEFMAITRVEVHANGSVIPDEFLNRRLNLIPIDSKNISKLVSPSDCYCDDICEQCSICYELDVYAEHDDTEIMSGMIQSPSDFKPTSNIRITTLRKDQHLKFKAYAQKGTAKQHTCFKHVDPFYTPTGEFHIEIIGTCDPTKTLQKVLDQVLNKI